MTEDEARDRGYSFTGVYEYHKEDLVLRAAEMKAKGYRTVVVPSRASGYERHAGVKRGMVLGYSLYAGRRYFVDQSIHDIQVEMQGIPKRRSYLLGEYNRLLSEVNAREARLTSHLTGLLNERLTAKGK